MLQKVLVGLLVMLVSLESCENVIPFTEILTVKPCMMTDCLIGCQVMNRNVYSLSEDDSIRYCTTNAQSHSISWCLQEQNP